MKRCSLIACWALLCSCTTRGPIAMSQRELQARGTHAFDGDFSDVYDAAYLSLEAHEGKVVAGTRLEGIIETDKKEFTAPAGWDGMAYRSYAVSVFQTGGQVSVTAVPRLFAGDKDVSEEPLWVLPGNDGEDSHWENLFDGIETLLHAWRDVPELTIDKARGSVTVLGVTLSAPADWRSLEQGPDRHSAFAQSTLHGASGCPECPGGLNPTIVFDVERRYPPASMPKLEHAALERALGPKLVEPEAWDATETPTGRRGMGQVVAGDPAKTVAVIWHVWDANEPAWMIRAAAACAPAEAPGGCEGQWDAMINGATTERH